MSEVEPLYSKSSGEAYPMFLLPENVGVHMGLGCEGEIFNGPMGCWHSKHYTREPDMTDETKAVALRPTMAVAQKLTFSPKQLDVIKNLICKGSNDEEFNLFVSVAERLDLDPFNKEIHAVFRSTKVSGRGETARYEDRMAIQIGIDGIRKVAASTGLYAGQEGPFFSEDGDNWSVVPKTNKPRLCRVKIHRKDFSVPIDSVCRWDAYVQLYEGRPMGLWASRGPEQLAKCTEALGLRRAFPRLMAEISSAVGTEIDERPIEDQIAAAADAPALPAGDEAPFAEGEWTEKAEKAPETPPAPAQADLDKQRDAVNNITSGIILLAQKLESSLYRDVTRALVKRFPDLLVDGKLKPAHLSLEAALDVSKAVRSVLLAHNLVAPTPEEMEALKQEEEPTLEVEEAPAGCLHPADALAAHPDDADRFVCGACGEEVKVVNG